MIATRTNFSFHPVFPSVDIGLNAIIQYDKSLDSSPRLGTLGVFFQLLLVIGILYAYCCGYARNVVVITILCGIAPLVFASIMIFMPESPLFYMTKNNEAAARKSMRFFRGPDYNIDPEINEFRVSVKHVCYD